MPSLSASCSGSEPGVTVKACPMGTRAECWQAGVDGQAAAAGDHPAAVGLETLEQLGVRLAVRRTTFGHVLYVRVDRQVQGLRHGREPRGPGAGAACGARVATGA